MGHLHGVGSPARRELMLRAAATSVALSALFIVVYGCTNWWTAQRPADEVRAWHFAWESTWIPYVPVLIVPYMSMDLFFFFATFLCRDRRELRTLALRVAFAIGVAALFFVLMPLKLAWPARPAMDGWFGEFVEASCTAPFLMEYPHNLFPSLHIVLLLIVADTWVKHTRGLVRMALVLWFALIGLSTLLTWQHHVVDIAGGLIVAAFAFYFVRESSERSLVTPNARIGGYYAAGAMVVFLAAMCIDLWGVFLLWPSTALAMTAAAYLGWGPAVFRKRDWRLPWSARVALAPVLLGHWLSLLHYRRQCRAWDEVTPSVWIGRVLDDAEAEDVVPRGVTAVLDLTAEFAEASPFLDTTYRNVAVLDLTAPTSEQLREAVAFIAAEAERGTVYVHCKIGYSRSAAVVAAYLLATGQASDVDDAIARLREARPAIVVRPEVIAALHRFMEAECFLTATP